MASDIEEVTPTGQGDWTVEAGDSIDSIAEQTGHFWQTLWDLPDNAGLKDARASRTVLLPGDKVTVPDIRQKQETRAVDLVHRFKRKGVPAEIKFQVQKTDGTGNPDCEYTLIVGKRVYKGKTDPDGMIHHYVSPSAKEAKLSVLTDPKDPSIVSRWVMKVGHLQPLQTIEGMQSRLNNLGYDCGKVDGAFGAKTQLALDRFLTALGLPIDEGYDEAAQDALRDCHGG